MDGTLGGAVVALVVGAGVVGLGAAFVLLDDVVGALAGAFRVVVLGLGTRVGRAGPVLCGLGRVVGFRVALGSTVGRAAARCASCWSVSLAARAVVAPTATRLTAAIAAVTTATS